MTLIKIFNIHLEPVQLEGGIGELVLVDGKLGLVQGLERLHKNSKNNIKIRGMNLADGTSWQRIDW